MCGIAGVVGKIEQSDADTAVRKMLGVLSRRGPDSEGIESWDTAVLGHRRLAIFDLSDAGRQPMVTENRSVAVVFNGAIYNFIELRQELIARGHSFASQTDTEVLIRGYEQWGLDELITRLRGMFAFALWDNSKRALYLVRDRLGVKPLVYTQRNGSIAFASTVRALKAAGCAGDIDENAIVDFLRFGFVSDDRSIYRGAVKVPAGTIVEWREGVVKARTYWKSAPPDDRSNVSFNDAVEETERLLLQSVENRLHADVPVGALLSGGIDSSLICWAIAKLGGNITAYTIGTPGDQWDETAAACDTAQTLGISHRVLAMNDSDSPDTDKLASAYAEPFACASALGMLRLSEAMAGSVKVMLTGDGGDDVFLGYPAHRHLWLAQNLSRVLPSITKKSWYTLRTSFPRIGPFRRAAALMDYAAGGLDAIVSYSNTLPMYKVQGLLGERLSESSEFQDKSWSVNGSGEHILQDYLNYERRNLFVGEYMTKVDGSTMHYGLEARSPFLDHRIWEFISSLPFGLRLRGGKLKAILREIARRRIGPAVANGRKKGFGVPVQRWIAGRWRPLLESMLNDSLLKKEGWINTDAARAQMRASRTNSLPQYLWYLLVLESWMNYEKFGYVPGRDECLQKAANFS